MKQLCYAIVIATAVAGCRLHPTPPKDPMEQVKENAPSGGSSLKELGLGDVEQVVQIKGTLAHESDSEDIGVYNMETQNHILTMATIFVYPPYPPQLWIEFTLADIYGYEPRPVVLRCTLIRQTDKNPEQQVDYFTLLVGVPPKPGSPESLRSHKIDVLADLQEDPETMLVYAKCEALLLPKETDLETLDLDSVTVGDQFKTSLRSNPVRINFEKDEPARE